MAMHRKWCGHAPMSTDPENTSDPIFDACDFSDAAAYRLLDPTSPNIRDEINSLESD